MPVLRDRLHAEGMPAGSKPRGDEVAPMRAIVLSVDMGESFSTHATRPSIRKSTSRIFEAGRLLVAIHRTRWGSTDMPLRVERTVKLSSSERDLTPLAAPAKNATLTDPTESKTR